jgi:hypothetical protein
MGQRGKFGIWDLPRVLISAFGLAFVAYVILSVGALFILGAESVFSIETGRWLFGVMFVVSIPISIRYLDRRR